MNARLPSKVVGRTLRCRSLRTGVCLALVAVGAAGSASAQYFTNFDCKVSLNVAPPPCGSWGAPKARQFVHAFEALQWTPLGTSYTPWPQPAGFDEYGCEYYVNGTITNRCFLCYPHSNPPMQAQWLERSLPMIGTPPGGFYAVAQPGSTGTRAYSEVRADPWTPTTPINVNLRSQSRWGEVAWAGSWGRGFSFTQVHLPIRLDPICFGGSTLPIVISFKGVRWEWLWGDNWGWSPIPLKRAYFQNRVFDPITYRATRADGTLIEEGTIMESSIDMLGPGPADIGIEETFDGSGVGTLSVNAQDAELRVRVEHPRLLGGTGSLFLSIRGGIVVASDDSGLYDGVLPPVGTASPFLASIPMLHAVTLDLTGLSAQPFDVTLVAGEGGAQPTEEVVHCPADTNLDGQLTPVDVATFVSTWFQSLQTVSLAGDFNGDGIVSPADVAAFVAEWANAVATGC